MDSPQLSTVSRAWLTACGKLPKEEVVYFSQVIVVLIVVIACIVNLSFGDAKNDTLWSSMLSGCVGYLLPAPKIGKKDVAFLSDATQQ
jgi:hypothetical protein